MFLVANASSVLFIISHVFAHVMASGVTLVCASESLGNLVEFGPLPFVAVLVMPDPMLLLVSGNGVDSCFLRKGSTKSTLVPVIFYFLSGIVFS